MRAGQLRHEITVQQTTEITSSSGAVANTWGTFATVRAAIIPLSGKEFFAAQQVNAETTLKFKIRYLAGITTKMRILHNSRIFNIRSIINYNELNHEMMLMVEEDV